MAMRRSLSPTDLAQKAFVRGLADEVDEEAVRRLFQKYGTVTDVHIAKDRETNSSRGFGFITFSSSTDCNKACEGLEGKDFHGRTLQVELASHFKKGGGGRGMGRGRGGFRGGRGGGSPPRDGYRRGGGSFRGTWRGGSGGGRGDYKGGYGGGRMSEERYRGGSYERDIAPRGDYGGRFDSFDYRGGRPERDYVDSRDYPQFRGARDYPPAGGSDRDYPPTRSRDYGGGYYSPPRTSRDYPPGSRDYPPPSRDYPVSRAERDFDLPPRRYSSRDYDDYPPQSGAMYDSRPPRREYEARGPAPREFGSSGRYESFGGGGGRGSYKSPRGAFRDGGDYAGRGGSMSARRPPRDDVGSAGMRRPQRNLDGGPPPKKMKVDEQIRRSPRGGGAASRRY